MARSTMADLIAQVRTRINADTADYTIGTASYWDADQIEGVLDRHRLEVWQATIAPLESYNSGGTVQYLDYPLGNEFFEQTDGGTAVFYLEAGDHTKIASANYTADYERGWVTFTADQKGSAYFLTGRSYDLDGAAAEIWRHKAARFAEGYDFSTDNMRVSRSQRMKHALDMAAMYDRRSKRSGFSVTTMTRSDIAI